MTPYVSAHTASATGSSTAPSVAVTSASGNMVVDVVANGSNITSSDKTQRWLKNVNTSNGGGNGAQSTAVGAASVTMSYTVTSDWWAIIGVDVNAAVDKSPLNWAATRKPNLGASARYI